MVLEVVVGLEVKVYRIGLETEVRSEEFDQQAGRIEVGSKIQDVNNKRQNIHWQIL